jgi:RHS repeat-associated protein
MDSFGMLVPNRFESVEDYKYGFQGQEKDNEIKGEGNSLNYTFRMHDPRAGRFFARDPLAHKYPWYSPYQFSGNKVIRFVELEGLEENNPSIFTKSLNVVAGDYYRNRMNAYITKNEIPEENIIELQNDTYIIIRVIEETDVKYSIFRKSKKTNDFSPTLTTSEDNDDIELSQEQFNTTELLGNLVMDAPGFGSVSKGAKGIQLIAAGGKSSFGQIVGAVNDVKVGLIAWKSEIKVGNLIANSGSKDLLTKGLHFHFKKFGGLELGLTAKNGVLAFKWLNIGKVTDINKAVEIFSKSMNNPQFRAVLNANVQAAKATINDSLKMLKGRDLENANKVLSELDEISKVLNK